MPTDDELLTAARDARMAILKLIVEQARLGVTATGLREIAEAYTLVTSKLVGQRGQSS
ncbi:hypothetical protein [Nakamurella flava]|uniref:hypothetical protein n=1 Tax=Nakamurella flava TaxID=2576308 RepID=UPI00140AB07A|nr:hypothetical protein [Nakamurella flava]